MPTPPPVAHRDDALPLIEAAFPEARLLAAIAAEEALEARAVTARERFSGKRVMAWFPELRGTELGAFIRSFRARYDSFEEAVSAMTPGEVEAAARAHYAAANWRSTSRR